MKKGMKIGCGCGAALLLTVVVFMMIVGRSYNSIVTLDEEVNQSWANVQTVYQRRADLIPNLVETVKGYAKHEKGTLQAVTEARAKLGGVTQLNAKDLTKENLAKFQQMQSGLSGALQRLMVVSERYPDLKANQNFTRLQDELAGTENRIAIARKRFNAATKSYNSKIRKFPAAIIAQAMKFTARAYFEAEQNAQDAPKVKF